MRESHLIKKLWQGGPAFEEILSGYPDLDREDIQQALEYAAWLTQEEVHLIEVQQ